MPGLLVSFALPVGLARGGIRSASVSPKAATMASVSQPAWQCSTAPPLLPCVMLRLARRSSCAGHLADQPLAVFLASGSFDRILSVGVIGHSPLSVAIRS